MPASAASNLVANWFGPDFAQLHPLLQDLHRQGGILDGAVDLRLGRGLAGWLGRRMAASIGLPQGSGCYRMRVRIAHSEQALLWSRQFDDGEEVRSVFQPKGCRQAAGYWEKSSGNLLLRLTVDIVNAGGHWRRIGGSVNGLPLPHWLLPRMYAYKEIELGKYRFHVSFALPGRGEWLC